VGPVPEKRLLPLRVVHAADRPFLPACQTLREKSIQIGFPSLKFDIDANASFGCYRDLNRVSGMRTVERNWLQKAAVRFDSGFPKAAQVLRSAVAIAPTDISTILREDAGDDPG
jgi:hypothetical protein